MDREVWAGFRVEGRVQGVGFRWWTAREAKRLGLRGFVRNRGDGSVEVCAWGRPEVLDRLSERLKRGPDGARVTAVQRQEVGETEIETEPANAEFEIRR